MDRIHQVFWLERFPDSLPANRKASVFVPSFYVAETTGVGLVCPLTQSLRGRLRAADMKSDNQPGKGPKRLAKPRAITRKKGRSRPPQRTALKHRPSRILQIPPLLLEDDPLVPLVVECRPASELPILAQPESQTPAQPESAIAGGTLFLKAVDSFKLYGCWHFDQEPVPSPGAATPPLWQLRVQSLQGSDKVDFKQPVALGSKDHFVAVPHAGSVYVAELGFESVCGRLDRGSNLPPSRHPSLRCGG